MAMIESVAVRHRGGIDFETHYDNLCALQSSCPLPAIKAHLAEGIINLNGDRIRAVDWIPILNTIRINKTLHLMAFRSYFQQTLEDQEKAGYPIKKKTPAIRCKEITYRLCRALKESLQVTQSLKCLEIQGLPLRERDLSGLSKGISKNNTLQHLSLEYSRIGDDGLEILLHGVKNSPSVTSINLAGCSLTWKGADHIAKIIKHQATKRHNEAWQDSLRYRRPDLDRMPGIRRITINSNPMLGDQGATLLAEALKDDLWLKALDLQQCGLSEVGAKSLLDVLKYNTTIVVLDVRQNPMIEQDMLHNIMEQVMINCNGQDTEYKWVKAEPLQDPMKPKVHKKRTKVLQNSFGKKTTIKVGQRRRSRSAGANVIHSQKSENVKPGPGMPWRTAQRANRYRGYPPENSPTKDQLYENISDVSASPLSSPGGGHVRIDYSTEEETSDTMHAYKGSKNLESDDDLNNDIEIKVELEHLRQRLRGERSARAVAQEKVMGMTTENKRLRAELEGYKTRHSILDDDRVLESIEASFKQFHAFLDLVRNAGLGQLITLAGIDQSEMAIPLSSPQRQSLGGRLSSSFIKPIRQDVTSNDPTTSPETSFRPITNGMMTMNQLSSINIHQSSLLECSVMEQTRNVTMNMTDVSCNGDISQPVPSSDLIFPHITPDNYTGNIDPTLPTAGVISISSMKPKSRFDELYQKVLRETEGALMKGNGDSLDSNAPNHTILNYSSHNGNKDTSKLEKSLVQSIDHFKHSDLGILSDSSHHSYASCGSKGSQKSTSKEISRDTVLQHMEDNTMEKLGLNPDNMIITHHSQSDKSKSNNSDISDIEEIVEELDDQSNLTHKVEDSDEEEF